MGKVLMMRKGETHTEPIGGIKASDLTVGSSVYLMENGTAAEYLVVQQGNPDAALYDASCDGTWLLRKNIYENRVWNTPANNDYGASSIHSYLNSTFLSLLGETEQTVINQIKIPYQNGTGSEGSISSGSNGLSAKIFLLSGYEVGWTTSTYSYFLVDGACLSYFSGTSATDTKRIAYLNGTASIWGLRSPRKSNATYHFVVNPNGGYDTSSTNAIAHGVRPALIIPYTAKFDKDTMILKG